MYTIFHLYHAYRDLMYVLNIYNPLSNWIPGSCLEKPGSGIQLELILKREYVSKYVYACFSRTIYWNIPNTYKNIILN